MEIANRARSGNPEHSGEFYLWGFQQVELGSFPADLRARARILGTGDLWPPPDALLIVRDTASAEYAEAAEPLHGSGSGSNPGEADEQSEAKRTILYVTNRSVDPQVDWVLFGGAINAGDWDMMKKLADHPPLLRTTPIAHQIAPDELEAAVRMLGSPGPLSVPGDLPTELNASTALPVPHHVPAGLRKHISQCEICRADMLGVLQDRVRAMYLMEHPSVARIGMYAYESDTRDEWVETHVPQCASCAAVLDTLRHMAQPAKSRQMQLLLNAALKPVRTTAREGGRTDAGTDTGTKGRGSDPVGELVAGAAREGMRRAAEIAGAFLRGLTQPGGGLRLAPTFTGHMGGGERAGSTSSPFDAESLMQERLIALRGSSSESTGGSGSRGRVELTLRWFPDGNFMRVERVVGAGDEAVEDYVLQLRTETRTVWSAESAEGTIEIPLSALEQAVQGEVDRLVLLTAKDEAPREGNAGSQIRTEAPEHPGHPED